MSKVDNNNINNSPRNTEQVSRRPENEHNNQPIHHHHSERDNHRDRVVSTRDDSWHRPFDFERIANDWFRELDRVSEQFGFPPSLFSRRLTPRVFDDDDDDFFGFDRHLSRWMPPAISRIMRDFDHEFRRPSSLFGGHDSRQLTEYTQKIFDELSNHKKDEQHQGSEGKSTDVMNFPPIEPDDELLNHNRDLEDFYNKFKSHEQSSEKNDNNNTHEPKIYGRSYTSSTICKDGKAVTVSKHSELNPDGTLKTRLDHKYRDNEGHDQVKSWEKCLDLKNNRSEQNMLKNSETH
jgi:hypothetical protein